METRQTRVIFGPTISMQQVAETLHLSRLATESLLGYDRVALDAAYSLDRRRRSVAIDITGDVGHTLGLVFLGYCRREFGAAAFELVPATKAQANNPAMGAFA